MIKSQLPQILQHTKSDTEAAWRLFVSKDLPFFNGHFAEQAVLPGVTQLDWVIKMGCASFGYEVDVVSLEVLKFQQLILPDTEVSLSITHNTDKQKLMFKIYDGDKRFASGRISINSGKKHA